ncbi:dihydrofolate reductase family protein [Rhizobium sp. RCAM05350]|nr:dihydrofolate reductase family protein [Rhizobium sp. RCAM05350]
MASGDLADEIAGLKTHDGKPIIAHGGGAFPRSLIAQGLVDQYALLVLRSSSERACRSSLTSPRQGASN